jgi:hypothetical protein
VNPVGLLPESTKLLLLSCVQIGSLSPFTLSVRMAKQSWSHDCGGGGGGLVFWTKHVHPTCGPAWHFPNELPAPTGVP